MIHDRRSGRVLAPSYDDSGYATSDHALIIRAPNPLAPQKSELVIVAGCFETLLETTVVNGTHYSTKAIETRLLPPLPDGQNSAAS